MKFEEKERKSSSIFAHVTVFAKLCRQINVKKKKLNSKIKLSLLPLGNIISQNDPVGKHIMML